MDLAFFQSLGGAEIKFCIWYFTTVSGIFKIQKGPLRVAHTHIFLPKYPGHTTMSGALPNTFVSEHDTQLPHMEWVGLKHLLPKGIAALSESKTLVASSMGVKDNDLHYLHLFLHSQTYSNRMYTDMA